MYVLYICSDQFTRWPVGRLIIIGPAGLLAMFRETLGWEILELLLRL